MINFTPAGGNGIGGKSAAVGTPWYAVVPGRANFFTRLAAVEYHSAGATENGIYVMRPIGQATVLQGENSGATSVILNADPSAAGNAISNGDQVVLLASDGTYRQTNATAGLTGFTLPVAALPAAISAQTTLWNFGIFSDTEPNTSLVFPKVHTQASGVYLRELLVGYAGWLTGQPLLLYCPNATHATNLLNAEYAHTGV